MQEKINGVKTGKSGKTTSPSSFNSPPPILDIEDFKGVFSFADVLGSLVNELLPSFQEDDVESSEGRNSAGGQDVIYNGHSRFPSEATKTTLGAGPPIFSEAESLLSLFKDCRQELAHLSHEVDARLGNLKKEVAFHDSKHWKTLSELEKGVDGLFESFSRLDSRISVIGQTAAKIECRFTKRHHLSDYRTYQGDLMELSPLFSDDS